MEFVGLFIGIAIVVVPIALILIAGDRWQRSRVPENQRESFAEKQRSETRSSLLVIVGIAVLIAICFVVGNPQLLVNLHQIASIVFTAMVGLFLMFFVGALVVQRIRFRKSRAAVLQANSGDVEGAILDIRRAIDEQPDSADLWNSLGVLLGQKEQFEEALSALERAEKLGADHSLILSNRAWILSRLSRTEEALAVNRLAIEQNPEDFSAAFNQCIYLVDLGRQSEAEEQLTSVEALHKKQTLLSGAARKQRRDSMDFIRRKVSSGPTSPGTADSRH